MSVPGAHIPGGHVPGGHLPGAGGAAGVSLRVIRQMAYVSEEPKTMSFEYTQASMNYEERDAD